MKPIMDKLNYSEKIDKASAPMAAVSQVGGIEECFWEFGEKFDCRTMFSSLRNQMLFLFTTKGILRCDCMYSAKLSDLFYLDANTGKRRDPHAMMVMILQFNNSKTNNGLKLFGRVGRHKNPKLCAVGAMAFYLFYRFQVTHEFDLGEGVDFLSNNMWFDLTLLTEHHKEDHSIPISNNTYLRGLKKCFLKLNLPTCHVVHIGRVLGSCESELDEDASDDLRNLGNWDPKIQVISFNI